MSRLLGLGVVFAAGAVTGAFAFGSRPAQVKTNQSQDQGASNQAQSGAAKDAALNKFKGSQNIPVDPMGIMKYGNPGPAIDHQFRQVYISAYDRRLRGPVWVAEHITPESLSRRGGDRKNSAFKEDESIPEKYRAKLGDYFRSGYDRGHMV